MSSTSVGPRVSTPTLGEGTMPSTNVTIDSWTKPSSNTEFGPGSQTIPFPLFYNTPTSHVWGMPGNFSSVNITLPQNLANKKLPENVSIFIDRKGNQGTLEETVEDVFNSIVHINRFREEASSNMTFVPLGPITELGLYAQFPNSEFTLNEANNFIVINNCLEISKECLHLLTGPSKIKFDDLSLFIIAKNLGLTFFSTKKIVIPQLTALAKELSNLNDLSKLIWATERQKTYSKNLEKINQMEATDLSFLASLLFSHYLFREFAKTGTYRLSYYLDIKMGDAFFRQLLVGEDELLELFNRTTFNSSLGQQVTQEYYRLYEVCKNEKIEAITGLYKQAAKIALMDQNPKTLTFSAMANKYEFARAAQGTIENPENLQRIPILWEEYTGIATRFIKEIVLFDKLPTTEEIKLRGQDLSFSSISSLAYHALKHQTAIGPLTEEEQTNPIEPLCRKFAAEARNGVSESEEMMREPEQYGNWKYIFKTPFLPKDSQGNSKKQVIVKAEFVDEKYKVIVATLFNVKK